MKKICSLFCIVFLFLSMIPFPVFALDAGNSHLPTFMPVMLTLSDGEKHISKTVNIGNGMYLTFSLSCTFELEPAVLRTTIRKTLTSECIVHGDDGSNLGTLTAKGVFDVNGRTSAPQDAYGYGRVNRYSIQNTSNNLSLEQFAAWVRVTLQGVPAGPVQEFTYHCVINCDANGSSSASWN